MTDATPHIPPGHTFASTVAQALRELGGSGSIEEISEKCVELRGLNKEQQAVPGRRVRSDAAE